MQKSCIFTQIKSKKCMIEILMRPRTQGTDLNNSQLALICQYILLFVKLLERSVIIIEVLRNGV